MIKVFLLVLLQIIWSSVQSLPQRNPGGITSYIIGGEYGTVKYQALLRNNGVPWCGGTFTDLGRPINDRLYFAVVTAASCVYGINKPGLTVSLGVEYLNETGITMEPQYISIHEGYEEGSYVHNIAIIFLPDTNFDKWSKAGYNVEPAQIFRRNPSEPFPNERNKQISVSGWGGPSQESLFYNNEVHFVDLFTIKTEDCASLFGDRLPTQLIVSKYVFCAGPVEGGKGPCSIDEGGPATREGNDVLAGIILGGLHGVGGAGCAQKNAPSVFTNVEVYYDWIQEKVGDWLQFRENLGWGPPEQS